MQFLKSNYHKMFVLGAVWIIMACWFWYYLSGNPFHELALIKHGHTIRGYIIDSWEEPPERREGKTTWTHGVTYTYRLPDGREFSKETKIARGHLKEVLRPPLIEPYPIEVEYLPHKPNISRIKGSGHKSILAWLVFKVGLGIILLAGFAIPGVLMIWEGTRKLTALMNLNKIANNKTNIHIGTVVHEKIIASSKAKLLHYLEQQDIEVPARTEGRNSQHCERWAIFRLLATWTNGRKFSYPLLFVHRDKPDSFLCYGKNTTGIEFTEAVPQEWAETEVLAEKIGIEPLIFSDQFKRGTPKRTKAEKEKLLKRPPVGGGGWGDSGPSLEWAEWMIERIHEKTKDLNKPDFEKYDKNLLLIYDNLPLPQSNVEYRMQELSKELSNYWPKENRYDEILIDSGNQLIKISSIGWITLPISDLWS